MRKALGGLIAFVAIAAAAAVATTPPQLDYTSSPPAIGDDVSSWLADSEKAVNAKTPLVPRTEKRIVWNGANEGARTERVLVYLHGFSATRMELSPVPERVAAALGANLFETRLSGHGLQNDPLREVEAEQWLDDVAEALAVATALGERIIVMGVSTGATLALAMADMPGFEAVEALILISPNFAPLDPNAEFLTWPFGPQLAHLAIGDMRSWEPANEEQALYWSTHYPTETLVETMRLVNYVRDGLPRALDADLLLVYSPEDQVVDPEKILVNWEKIDAPRKDVMQISSPTDPGNHVIAGDIMSPQNNALLANAVVAFLSH